MNLSPFFRLVWKINALIILLAGLMACGLIAYAGFINYRSESRRNETRIVNVASNANISAEWRLGYFNHVEGSEYLVAPAYSKQNYDVAFGSSSKEASAVRNYLFVNAVDKSSHWLVPSNNQLFLENEDVARMAEEQNGIAKWKMYKTVRADTNGDERLTESDKRTIGFSDAVGTNYVEVISDIDGILSTQIRDDDTVLVFYTSSGKNLLTEINIPARRVTVTKELPQIQP
jgi:hypothetical protein